MTAVVANVDDETDSGRNAAMAKKGISGESVRVTFSTYRWGFSIAGATAVIVGLLILLVPTFVTNTIAILIALYALVAGVLFLYIGVTGKELSALTKLGRLVSGLVFVMAAVLIFTFMDSATGLLTNIVGVTVGVMWLVDGVMTLLLMRDGTSSGWVIGYAVAAVAAGVVLVLTPIWGPEVLRWLVGFSLVILGFAQVLRANWIGREIQIKVVANED